MNQPKLAITTADAKRVVRRLADSLNSLQAKPKPPRPSTAAAPVQQPHPVVPQKDHVQAVEPVRAAAPAIPRRATPRPASRAVAVALPPTSAFKGASRSASKHDRVKSHREIIDDFRGDRELIERLGVTPEEIQTLSRVSMLGNLTCKQDALFVLRQIREARGPYDSGATPETLEVPYQAIEPAIPDIGEMVEWIRSQALAKLRRSEPILQTRSRSSLRQFDILSSIKMMLSRRRQASSA